MECACVRFASRVFVWAYLGVFWGTKTMGKFMIG